MAAAAAQMNRGGSLVRRVASFKNPVTLVITFLQIVDGIPFLLTKSMSIGLFDNLDYDAGDS